MKAGAVAAGCLAVTAPVALNGCGGNPEQAAAEIARQQINSDAIWAQTVVRTAADDDPEHCRIDADVTRVQTERRLGSHARETDRNRTMRFRAPDGRIVEIVSHAPLEAHETPIFRIENRPASPSDRQAVIEACHRATYDREES